MPTSRFDPRWPTHAIERCSLTIAFKEDLPERLFASTKSKHHDALLHFGLIEQLMIGMSIDVVTGQVTGNSSGSVPVSYVRSDSSAALTMSPKALVWGSTQYTRWAQFKSQLETTLFPVLRSFSEVIDPILVRLDYLDRFIWTGTWSDFDLSGLMRPGLDVMPLISKTAKRERHTHNGWFEPNGRLRRLVNRNVDVVEGTTLGSKVVQPSVGIYTLLQDEFIQPFEGTNPLADIKSLQQAIEQQHLDLKAMMTDTISENMAKRIGLIQGGWQNAGV